MSVVCICLFVILSTLSFVNKCANLQSCSSSADCPDFGLCYNGNCTLNSTSYSCVKNGTFTTCGSNGIVTGECASGADPGCGSNYLCGYDNNQIWEGIECNYPSLVPENGGFNTTKWLCGNYGEYLLCSNVSGSVVTGLCGVSIYDDCKQYCDGLFIKNKKKIYYN